jgi:hypothetical protein
VLFYGSGYPEWVGAILLFTVYSGIIGAIPYLALVALLLWWAWGKSEQQVRRGLILSPIMMLPIFWLCLGVACLVPRETGPKGPEFLEGVLFYTPFILGFGYGYVLLTLGAVFVLKHVWMIAKSEAI